ncbi:FAD-dependent monooxygenase, partial [Streptomyces lydicus]|uniref:FAD-dependent monooxygenase n=1 Tax=Streptomyces lydicus TaxID=47763 RepID=UPI003F4D0B01
GAFGSNTGIQDAHNLAWKLAAVLDGAADPALLLLTPAPTGLQPLLQREGLDRRTKSGGPAPHPTITRPAAGGTSHAL